MLQADPEIHITTWAEFGLNGRRFLSEMQEQEDTAWSTISEIQNSSHIPASATTILFSPCTEYGVLPGLPNSSAPLLLALVEAGRC